jgi:hypothetical protein
MNSLQIGIAVRANITLPEKASPKSTANRLKRHVPFKLPGEGSRAVAV